MTDKELNSIIDGIIAQLQMLKVENNVNIPVPDTPAAVPSVMPITEAAAFSGFSPYFIRKLCRENKLVHINSGKKIYVNVASLKEYAKRA